MPICPKCRALLDDDLTCSRCGNVGADVTQDDGRVQQAEVAPLRPAHRPPVARLVIIDDDSDHDGEIVRLRRSETSIGRKNCDINIAHDADVSAEHATIRRAVDQQGRYRWRLLDCESTNGVFVQVDRWRLGERAEFRIGAVACQWTMERDSHPKLSFLTQNISEPVSIPPVPETTLGRSTRCPVLIGHETVNPIHAVLAFDGAHWLLRDCDSVNGVWIRVTEHALSAETRFLLGQQRFRFVVPQTSGEAPS